MGLFLYVLLDPVVFTNEQKRSRVFSVSVIDLFLSLIITLTGLQVNWATQITWCTTELFLPWLLENLCPRLWPPSCKLLTVWVWCKCSAATRKIMYCLRDVLLPLLGRSRHSTVTISTPPYSSLSPLDLRTPPLPPGNAQSFFPFFWNPAITSLLGCLLRNEKAIFRLYAPTTHGRSLCWKYKPNNDIFFDSHPLFPFITPHSCKSALPQGIMGGWNSRPSKTQRTPADR